MEYATGKRELAFGPEYTNMCLDYNHPHAYMRKDDSLYRMETQTGIITEVATFPPGKCNGHLSVSKSGLVWCTYHQANKIYALVMLDPSTGKSEVVFQDDHFLNHCQACPGDDETVMYVHETYGDALQRIWMYDHKTRRVRPYYVEKEGDWITHEVWKADGEYLYFIKYPHSIMRGTRDGHSFVEVARSNQFLHAAPDRSGKWLVADRITGVHLGTTNQITLVNAETGEEEVLAYLDEPSSGAEHPHPSFNRRGDVVLFNKPIANGKCNVCTIDLNQVKSFTTP
jgi:oligogalacturonide lyase